MWRTAARARDCICVCCGAVVPEGWMVCWACEQGLTPAKEGGPDGRNVMLALPAARDKQLFLG